MSGELYEGLVAIQEQFSGGLVLAKFFIAA
jgi:hypothetical protein